jgi:hypothetical protein
MSSTTFDEGKFLGVKPRLHNISHAEWSRNQPDYSKKKAEYKDLTNNPKHSQKQGDPFFKGNQRGIYYYRYKNNNWQDIYNRRALSPSEQIKVITGGKIKVRVISYHGNIGCNLNPTTFTPSQNVIIIHDAKAGDGSYVSPKQVSTTSKLKGYTEVLKKLKSESKELFTGKFNPLLQTEIIKRFRKLFIEIIPRYYPIEDVNDSRMGQILFPSEFHEYSIPRRYDELYQKYKKQWDNALATQQQLNVHPNMDEDFLVGKAKKWEKYLDMPCDDKPMCVSRINYRKKGRSNFNYNRPICCPKKSDMTLVKSNCRLSKNPTMVAKGKRCYWDYESSLKDMNFYKRSRDDQLQEMKTKFGIHNPDKNVATQYFNIDPDDPKAQIYQMKKMIDQNNNKITGGVYVLNDNFKLINLPLFTFNPGVFGKKIDLQTIIKLDRQYHSISEEDIFIYIVESCRYMDFDPILPKYYVAAVRDTVDELSDDETELGEELNLTQYLKYPIKERRTVKSKGGKRRKTRRKKRTKKKARKRKKTRRKRN